MLRKLGLVVLLVLTGLLASLARNAPERTEKEKKKVLYVSWGDDIYWPGIEGVFKLDTPEKVPMAVKAWKERGFSRVLLRLDDVRILNLANIRHSEGEGGYSGYAQTWQSVTRDAIKTNMFRLFVDSCHSQQMEVFGWITIFDEGTPADVEYMTPQEAKKSWPMYDHAPTRFLWVTKFTQQHPEFLVTDRNQQRVQHGVMEYAYPEVRRYMREVIRDLVERYEVDGVFLSTRTHSVPAEHGDQFGFNEPVVKEFERRYGVNILQSMFDLEKWRQLRGEFLTQFLRETHSYLKGRGKQLSIGIPQGNHLGPPFGNLSLDWRTWVQEKLVDELVVGHIAGRFVFPARPVGYGYVNSQEDGFGVLPIVEDVQKNYRPWCQQHGCRLYVDPHRFRLQKPSKEELMKASYVDGVMYSSLEEAK
jgi:Glycosyl hydrolase-like 10